MLCDPINFYLSHIFTHCFASIDICLYLFSPGELPNCDFSNAMDCSVFINWHLTNWHFCKEMSSPCLFIYIGMDLWILIYIIGNNLLLYVYMWVTAFCYHRFFQWSLLILDPLPFWHVILSLWAFAYFLITAKYSKLILFFVFPRFPLCNI